MKNQIAVAPKLCLKCARQKMAGKQPKPCGSCILLNVDPMAQVRANAARPSPAIGFRFFDPSSFSSLCGGTGSKPARPTPSGRRG